MNLRQMEIFLRVTECESFLEAANSLFMSQSAVSQQIIRMEKELGFPLFQRNGRGIQLTESGARYSSGVREILRIHRATVAACISPDCYHTTIGCTGFSSYYYLPQAIKYMQELYPQAQIVTYRVDANNFEKELEQGNVDLVFIAKHIAAMSPKLKFQFVADTPLYCVVSAKNPLARKNVLTVSDLLDSTVVMPDEKYCAPQIRKFVSTVLAKKNSAPLNTYSFRIQHGSDIDNALLHIRMNSRCVAIVPAFTLPVHSEIISIPISDSEQVGIGFAFKKKLSILEEELIHICRKIAMSERFSI